MKNVVIVTAKGGNLSLRDKHLVEVAGRPLVFYPIRAALDANLVDAVFVSTEDQNIAQIARAAGAQVLDRPKELARSDTNHGDVIVQAARNIQERFLPEIGIVTILLGNTVMLDGSIIDSSIQAILERPDIDSSMTVWKAQDDHPMRAMVIGSDGFLRSYHSGSTPDTNRQSYPAAYFYDQGPWSVRATSLFECARSRSGGPGAWWWMGRNCVPIQRGWMTGRDVHDEVDLWACEAYLKEKLPQQSGVILK